MQIKESRENNVVIVAPVGRVDSTTAPALEVCLFGLVDQGERTLIVDFGEVEYISSAGLRVMLVLAKRLGAPKGTLVLCGMPQPVRHVFDLAGFLPLFSVEATRDDARRRLSP